MSKSNSAETMAAELTAEQQERAALILQHLRTHADRHLEELALLLASKPDSEVFGQVEFEARDILHRIGVAAMQASLDSREKKGATKVLAASARPATTTRGLSSVARAP